MGGSSVNWDKAIATVRPHVVKIATPAGYGTGFLAFSNHDQTWCGIATAAHVVKHADEWQEPIRIRNPASFRFLKFEERVIFPETPIALMPVDQPCGIGIDLGWLGYPAIEPDTLCFFAGVVSARLEVTKAYLVDGVSIHGISGGPVFHCPSPTSDDVQVIGCVSAYHANRATGEALPGLIRAQDVSHFHQIAGQIRSIDEANVKKREFEEAQKQRAVADASGISAPETDPAPT
jgi:hypothetical protein